MSPRRAPGDAKPYKRKDGHGSAPSRSPPRTGRGAASPSRRRTTTPPSDPVRKLRKKVAAGQVSTVTANTTVSKWLEHWLETIQRPHVRPTTYRYYEGTVRNLIQPLLGGKRLDRLTPEDVRRMHRAIQDGGSTTERAEGAAGVAARVEGRRG
jgi:hypothetical protein